MKMKIFLLAFLISLNLFCLSVSKKLDPDQTAKIEEIIGSTDLPVELAEIVEEYARITPKDVIEEIQALRDRFMQNRFTQIKKTEKSIPSNMEPIFLLSASYERIEPRIKELIDLSLNDKIKLLKILYYELYLRNFKRMERELSKHQSEVRIDKDKLIKKEDYKKHTVYLTKSSEKIAKIYSNLLWIIWPLLRGYEDYDIWVTEVNNLNLNAIFIIYKIIYSTLDAKTIKLNGLKRPDQIIKELDYIPFY